MVTVIPSSVHMDVDENDVDISVEVEAKMASKFEQTVNLQKFILREKLYWIFLYIL